MRADLETETGTVHTFEATDTVNWRGATYLRYRFTTTPYTWVDSEQFLQQILSQEWAILKEHKVALKQRRRVVADTHRSFAAVLDGGILGTTLEKHSPFFFFKADRDACGIVKVQMIIAHR